ncbi:5222_t:CDS:2 [Ambispora gerdemannii]|uniref:5222_t:CDS:1 n=1 Tax=Ambispora gerdemannii TaxID=144530 RepID=A0A9N8VV71_9GLOM|nr:5222_t:CDS:2 [Ambispora gerdemannii]
MSKLISTPPLVSLNPAKSVQEVEIRLHEPLIQKPGSRKKRIGLQVLNALTRLELLLNKEEAFASADQEVQNISQQQYNSTEIDNTINMLLTSLPQLEEEAIAMKKDMKTYITELGLASLFPKSARRLVVSKLGTGTVDVQAHFIEMTLINQLVSISLQLQQDTKLENHFYMAHQIALLYQCLAQVGQHFLKYKPCVELHFDAIKSLTSRSKEPHMNEEQREWLSQLTADIVTEALFSGRPFSTVSEPLANYMTLIGKVDTPPIPE